MRRARHRAQRTLRLLVAREGGAAAFGVLALAVFVFSWSAAGSGEREAGDGRVLVIGDSIAYWSRLHADPPFPSSWAFDAVPGRKVTELARLDSHPKRPVRTVVIALGTNGTDTAPTPEGAVTLYRDAIARLRRLPIWAPGPKRVVLVTPYTASWVRGDNWGSGGQPFEPEHWTDRVAVYASAVRSVADTEDDVCVMPWAERIATHPGWLPDGIHPITDGEALWRTLLTEAVAGCGSR